MTRPALTPASDIHLPYIAGLIPWAAAWESIRRPSDQMLNGRETSEPATRPHAWKPKFRGPVNRDENFSSRVSGPTGDLRPSGPPRGVVAVGTAPLSKEGLLAARVPLYTFKMSDSSTRIRISSFPCECVKFCVNCGKSYSIEYIGILRYIFLVLDDDIMMKLNALCIKYVFGW